MRSIFLEFLLAFVATAQSAAVPSSHVLHEKRDPASSKQWVRREKLASTEILPMRIGLKQRNLHRGHDFLMDNSHPDSANYGKHWTSSQIIDMFAPEQKSVDAVQEWLDGFGIGPRRVSRSQNKGWLAFDATTEAEESLLHTEYHHYEHRSLGHTTLACESYHLPKHIQEHVDYITPGIKLFASTKNRRNLKRGFGEGGFPLVATPEGFPGTAVTAWTSCGSGKWCVLV